MAEEEEPSYQVGSSTGMGMGWDRLKGGAGGGKKEREMEAGECSLHTSIAEGRPFLT